MYLQFRRQDQVKPTDSNVPLVFSGRLYLELRWTSVTTPLVVTLGTHGQWSLPGGLSRCAEMRLTTAKLGDHATSWLRTTYRGKNVRDMIPRLTSDLLPSPAVDEITTE